jgi:DNA-binding response OmpR family regulator
MASRGTCLVIEDDHDVRGLIRYILTREGFEVREAMFGEDGIKAAAEPDLVLITVDVGLPDINGLDVAARIREITTVPLVFITACAETSDQPAGMATGAAGYLIKPFRPTELRSVVNHVCPREMVRQTTARSKSSASE